MVIKHAKTATFPETGPAGNVHASDWNADHDGGIDFDQVNTGTSLDVEATGVASLKLNDMDDLWDVNLVGIGGNAIYIGDDAGVNVNGPNNCAITVNADGSANIRAITNQQIDIACVGTEGVWIQSESTGRLGFYGQWPTITKPTVTGSKGGNAALGSLLTALGELGLITDSTT